MIQKALKHNKQPAIKKESEVKEAKPISQPSKAAQIKAVLKPSVNNTKTTHQSLH